MDIFLKAQVSRAFGETGRFYLDGILYPQRMDDLSSFGYVEEMQKALKG